MSRIVAVLVLALALVGCDRPNVRPVIEPPKPVANVCDEACKTPCEDAKQVARWECTDPDDGDCWDLQQIQVINPLVTLAERCEIKRQSCMACIERADTAKATCGTTTPCGQE